MNQRISFLRSLILIGVFIAVKVIIDISEGVPVDWKAAIFYAFLFGIVDVVVSFIRSKFEKW